MLDTPAALAWVANYGAIELHPWTSTRRTTRTARRGRMIDIDPGDREHASTTSSRSPGCTAPRSTTSASQACPR